MVKLLIHCQAMPTSEKFYLRWNDFQENINSAFRDLRKGCEFTDVTLACEDGYQVEAHKIILSAFCPFFQNLLKKNKHANPLIYMRGVKSEDLVAIVDFLYYGKANIHQDNLYTFLIIAEELQLKGLNGTEGGDVEGGEEGKNPTEIKYNPKHQSIDTHGKNDTFETKVASQNNSDNQITSNMVADLPRLEFSGDMKALNEKIDSLMCQGVNMMKKGKANATAHTCKICGKEGLKQHIKEHIEANHITGISIPCNLCEKTSSSRNALRHHYMRTHN